MLVPPAQAAEIDGTPAWRRFWRITLPQLRGTTFFLSITVLLSSFQVFDIINVMTGGGPFEIGTTTMVFQVYQETFVNSRAGYGAAVATIMFLVVLLITAGNLIKPEKDEEDEESAEANNFIIRIAKRFMHTTDHYDGDKLFTMVDGKKAMTLRGENIAREFIQVIDEYVARRYR